MRFHRNRHQAARARGLYRGRNVSLTSRKKDLRPPGVMSLIASVVHSLWLADSISVIFFIFKLSYRQHVWTDNFSEKIFSEIKDTLELRGETAKLAHLLESVSLKKKYVNRNCEKICIE